MRITIETIPQKDQRYDTIGDWQFLGDDLIIKISSMDHYWSELLVGIHELIEAVLCKAFGISDREVDGFDMSHPELEDPGGNENAPYHMQHVFAEIIERLVCAEMGIEWNEYESVLEKSCTFQDTDAAQPNS